MKGRLNVIWPARIFICSNFHLADKLCSGTSLLYHRYMWGEQHQDPMHRTEQGSLIRVIPLTQSTA